MAKHAAVPRRRVNTRRIVAATAILVVTAAGLFSGLSSHNPVSAAGTQTAAAFSIGTTTRDGAASRARPALAATVRPATESATAAAAIALLETGSAPALSATPRAAAQPVAAPVTPDPAPTPAEQQAVPAPPPPPVSTSEPAPAAPPPAPSAPPSAEALVTGRTMYATEPVNVRNAPGTNGTSVLVTLDPRDQVAAGDDVDGWLPVHAGAFYGWVKSGYLADGTAPEPAPAAVAPAAAQAQAQAQGESAANWMEALIPQIDPDGAAAWVFRRNGGWGASDGHTNYIDPNVPADKRFSVMVHELSHVRQVAVYGSLSKSVAAMSAITGSSSSDVSSNEKTADCMALMLGASWINYGCPDSLQGAASAILAGHRP